MSAELVVVPCSGACPTGSACTHVRMTVVPAPPGVVVVQSDIAPGAKKIVFQSA